MKKVKLFLVSLLLVFLAIYSCQVEDSEVKSDNEFEKVDSDFLNHKFSNPEMKPLWKSAVTFDNVDAVEVNFLTNERYNIPLSENKKVLGRQRLLLMLDKGLVQEMIIDYIPSNKFSGDIKKINSGNFVTQFDGKVTLKKVGENSKIVWYVAGGKIIKKTILIPTNSAKKLTSKTIITPEVTSYYSVYYGWEGSTIIGGGGGANTGSDGSGWASSGGSELNEVIIDNGYKDPDSWDGSWTGSVYPDYGTGYDGSDMYDDLGNYIDPSGGGNGEVTTTIEDQINGSKLNPCAKSILEQLKNASVCDIKEIIDRLDNHNSKYTLNFKSEVAPSGFPAQTTWDSVNNYTTYISTDYVDKTELFIAAAMLHETAHAYFMSIYDDYYNASPKNPNAYDNFPYLFDFYVTLNNPESIDAADYHHQQMATDYTDAIARALQEYQTGTPVSENSSPQQIYTDLAWGGLSDAPIFNTMFPNENDRQRILNRYASEQVGHTIGQGENAQTPISQPCK